MARKDPGRVGYESLTAIGSRLDEIEPQTLALRYMLKEDKGRITILIFGTLVTVLLFARNVDPGPNPHEAIAWTILAAYLVCTIIVQVWRYRRHYRSGQTLPHRLLIERNVIYRQLKKIGFYYAGGSPGETESRAIRWSHTGQPIRREDFDAGIDPYTAALKSQGLGRTEVDAKSWTGPDDGDLWTIIKDEIAARSRHIEQPYAHIEETNGTDQASMLVDFDKPSEGDNAALLACFGSILIVRIFEAPLVLADYRQDGELVSLLLWCAITLLFGVFAVWGLLNLVRGDHSIFQRLSRLLVRLWRFFLPDSDQRNR